MILEFIKIERINSLIGLTKLNFFLLFLVCQERKLFFLRKKTG